MKYRFAILTFDGGAEVQLFGIDEMLAEWGFVSEESAVKFVNALKQAEVEVDPSSGFFEIWDETDEGNE